MKDYSFDEMYREKVRVPIPELDAFIESFRELCREHGVGLSIAEDLYDEFNGRGVKLALVPFEQAEFGFVVEALQNYEGGVLWLDSAREEFKRKDAEMRKAADLKEQRNRANLERVKIEIALRKGIEIGGKRFRVVPEAE